jgi:hypothetical protein
MSIIPRYETSKVTYPVMYPLHGSGDTENGWVKVGRANFIPRQSDRLRQGSP